MSGTTTRKPITSVHCDDRSRGTFAIAARLLQYPDERLIESLPDLDRLAERVGRKPRGLLAPFLDSIRQTPLLELQAGYVETFDLRRRNSLYLTYARAGDTRGRGSALIRFVRLYRDRGYSLVGGELADFLPALLELTATVDPSDPDPFELLVEHRPEIGLLAASLEAAGSPYAAVVRAVELALPRPDAEVIEAIRKLAEDGPPDEQVGVVPDFVWESEGCLPEGVFDRDDPATSGRELEEVRS